MESPSRPQEHFILLRHTRVYNPQNLCYGQSEMELANSFSSELRHIKRQLQPIPKRLIVSPSQRCRQLADALSDAAPLIEDERLRELNFGTWEQTPWHQINRSELDHWAENYVHRSPPAGESFQNLQTRAIRAIQDRIQAKSGGSILVVTHAGVMRALYCFIEKLELDRAFSLDIAYGEICRWPLTTVQQRFDSIS